MKRILLGFAAVAMLANAATFKLDLVIPSVINGQELKPGEYKVSYDNQSITLSQGKQNWTAPARVEPVEGKIKITAVRYTQDNNKLVVQEIRIGGSTTKLVLDQAHDAVAGGTR